MKQQKYPIDQYAISHMEYQSDLFSNIATGLLIITVILFIVGITMLLSGEERYYLLTVCVLPLVFSFVFASTAKKIDHQIRDNIEYQQKLITYLPAYADYLNDSEFLHYISAILIEFGYHVWQSDKDAYHTLDLMIQKEEEKGVIKILRSRGDIHYEEIEILLPQFQNYVGVNHYYVCTDSRLTSTAARIAQENHLIIIDRDLITRLQLSIKQKNEQGIKESKELEEKDLELQELLSALQPRKE